ncbi:winged helix-turn-helix domain-containing protein [Campylobacter sp. US33a]|uniref:Winged helix-turn-helix domain-containing protein n=1 Tax=Campylobacter sp. CCS1377 TaxID=3158229 RepID=A0AAU7E8A5_9BACT|nr:winged helix-turn-helix domain-containing protein [Campylobacter sp. US33a]TEY04463.1 LysR family transcriptional regulator [Campylobacter sp. US33a]
MDKEILAYMKELLNSNEKLDCGTAFKIAKKFNISVEEVGNMADVNGIRIDNCELGQFGHLDFEKAKIEVLKELEPNLDEKRRIFCKDARNIAKQGCGLKSVRSALKSYKIDVKYCQLGCFKEKKGKQLVVRTKTWIENADGDLLFGKGKTELLELIGQTGSILQASKLMGINYKKAWMHLQILQKNTKEDLVATRQGRSKDSGTKLTPKALELMHNYSILQKDIEEYANKRFKELFFKEKNPLEKESKIKEK